MPHSNFVARAGVTPGAPKSKSFFAAFFSKKAVLACFLLLSACGSSHPTTYYAPPSAFGTATPLTCVPYAREVSGIQLSGDAWQWWDEADGVYQRSQSPAQGAVLVFKARRGMESGHLAVVTSIQDSRTILITQSNWLPHRIEHDQPVIDVSPGNDWTEVRVWYEPVHAMGSRVYETYGFILPR